MTGEWKRMAGTNGLPRIVFDDGTVAAELYLNGAHLTAVENRRTGRSLLWLLPDAEFLPGRAIRGGVPLIFPWFGKHPDPSMPGHGFARNRTWTVAATAGNRAELTLEDCEETRALWPHRFRARLGVEVSEGGVAMDLTIANTDSAAFTYEAGYHPYFAVGDVRDVQVEGLEGCRYLDKILGGEAVQQGGVRFPGVIDRVYVEPAGDAVIREGAEARVRVSRSEAREIVVWNPGGGRNGSPAPPFVCVEPATCVEHRVTIGSGEEHTMATRFEWI
ncbi:MAG: glucose-6-phosphate 1-epimerase [Candidatus Sumerlaeota bacterium]|nr:glucose-6-phosphate 1-epimerase [Candidatus Sumerlaeota bacterium]